MKSLAVSRRGEREDADNPMELSVVVPVFNGESWIRETLDSVRLQGDDLEVIVVDDHSQDRSADVAREFLEQSGLTGRVMTTDKNQGPANARNLGWQCAAAQWIQFLDADDLLSPGKLDVQYANAIAAPEDVAVVYSPWQHIGLFDGQWTPYGPLVEPNVDKDSISRILRDQNFGYVGPTLMRRSALEAVQGFSAQMTIGEDLDLMLRIAMSGYRFQLVTSLEPLFFYRDTPGSLWHQSVIDSNAVLQLLLSIRSAELQLQSTNGTGISVSTKEAIARRYVERLNVFQSRDRENFEMVLGWISDLHLRSAPAGSGIPARLVAMTIGLSNALRLQFAVRNAIRPLRPDRA